MPRIERESYWIEEEDPWSINRGAIGIEVGDVQTGSTSNEVPVYISWSVKEFWIQLPHSDYELNILATGFNILLHLEGVVPVRGSQIGLDVQPYTREVFVETYDDTNSDSATDGAVRAKTGFSFESIKSFGLSAAAEGSVSKSNRKKASRITKKSEKKIQTRINYFPQNIWHVRCDFEDGELSFFDGTVFSDVICRVEGLQEQAKINAEIEFPPEYIQTNKIRNIKTAELIERSVFPDASKSVGDDGYMTSNAKLAVISALLKKMKSENGGASLIMASHSLSVGRKRN